MPTIIVPTDFSENADNAIRYASQIALHGGGTLLLLHTLIFPATTAPQGFVSIPADPRQIEDCEEALLKLATKIQEEYEYAFEVKTICLFGELIPHLNELINTQAAELVVMGTRGASNFLDRLLGTNTANFIKKAHCPVLVVPGHATYKGLSHIAYASDFETDETVYLKQLFQFASPFGSEVSIVNVKSDKQLDIVSDPQVLKTINKHFPENTYNIVQLLNSDVVAGIKTYVEENDVNVLAVSIQERGFIESLLHSSVTQTLAYQAFVPLLALPKNPYHYQAHKSSEKKPLSAI